jgi:hypothetical protein
MKPDPIVGVRQEGIKTWTVTRNLLDPLYGDNGFTRMKVFAFTGPEAGKLADKAAFDIKEDYRRKSDHLTGRG